MTPGDVRVVPAQAGTKSPRRVGILGAPRTGRTQLAAELSAHLANPGVTALAIAEIGPEGLAACDSALLMGLDLPSAAGSEAEDARLRTLLLSAGVPFQIIYGHGAQRLHAALRALDLVERQDERSAGRAWTWVCDKCSDPACEHRLFTRLKESR